MIITTKANERLAPLHDRMPVVLPPDVWDEWLDVDNEDTDELRLLLVPAPADSLHFWPVSTLVNKATNEGPELIEAVEPESALEPGLFDPVVEH